MRRADAGQARITARDAGFSPGQRVLLAVSLSTQVMGPAAVAFAAVSLFVSTYSATSWGDAAWSIIIPALAVALLCWPVCLWSERAAFDRRSRLADKGEATS